MPLKQGVAFRGRGATCEATLLPETALSALETSPREDSGHGASTGLFTVLCLIPVTEAVSVQNKPVP